MAMGIQKIVAINEAINEATMNFVEQYIDLDDGLIDKNPSVYESASGAVILGTNGIVRYAILEVDGGIHNLLGLSENNELRSAKVIPSSIHDHILKQDFELVGVFSTPSPNVVALYKLGRLNKPHVYLAHSTWLEGS